MAELARHRLAPCRCRPEEAALLVDSCGLALAETGFWSGADISHRTMSPPPTVAACRTRAAAYPPGLRLVNYTADEIVGAPELDESLRAYACSLHEAGIEQLLVAPPNRALFDDGSGSGSPAIDIWVLLGVYFDAEHLAVAREALAAGMEVWSYTTANQDDFSPKWQIDFAPVNFRALPGFINQSLGFTGVLYWAVDRWTADPWNDLSCVLDGGSYPANAALVYPGAPVGVGGTVASMRLKWIRQGMQDYEYVELLKRSGQEATALALSRSVAQDLRVWSQDPEQYETVRRQIGRMLSVGDQDR
jgi:hypothetical protein